MLPVLTPMWVCAWVGLALAATTAWGVPAGSSPTPAPATRWREKSNSMVNMTLPMAYMQSAFTTGHAPGVPCRTHGNIDPTLPRSARLALLRQYASNATSFRGGEMFINTLETPAAMLDVRAMNALILKVRRTPASPLPASPPLRVS